ncbi:hypothetical protein F511_17113 [Dorcoceras hygrometricum]|uniref:Uncharacterized protein n=1 Tax=Dorcoceras hygrometricum TaxID=472368 RepID=A0A2Z7CNB3_9LAMI|nr:hypothetical protein F511_17113 [Dorcoceras hygrometricum]
MPPRRPNTRQTVVVPPTEQTNVQQPVSVPGLEQATSTVSTSSCTTESAITSATIFQVLGWKQWQKDSRFRPKDKHFKKSGSISSSSSGQRQFGSSQRSNESGAYCGKCGG